MVSSFRFHVKCTNVFAKGIWTLDLVRVGSNDRNQCLVFFFTRSISKSTIYLIHVDLRKLLFHNFFASFWVATVLCVKAGFPKSNQMGQKRKDEFFRYFRISFEKVDALKALEKWWPTDRRTEKGHPSMTFTKQTRLGGYLPFLL